MARLRTACGVTIFNMDETTARNYPKRLYCDSYPLLYKAVHEYMSKNDISSERKAVESLLRESLTSRGHLPAPKA